jgi:hypothetical protein
VHQLVKKNFDNTHYTYLSLLSNEHSAHSSNLFFQNDLSTIHSTTPKYSIWSLSLRFFTSPMCSTCLAHITLLDPPNNTGGELILKLHNCNLLQPPFSSALFFYVLASAPLLRRPQTVCSTYSEISGFIPVQTKGRNIDS